MRRRSRVPDSKPAGHGLALTALALTGLTGATQVAAMAQTGMPAHLDLGSKGKSALWGVAAIINKSKNYKKHLEKAPPDAYEAALRQQALMPARRRCKRGVTGRNMSQCVALGQAHSQTAPAQMPDTSALKEAEQSTVD